MRNLIATITIYAASMLLFVCQAVAADYTGRVVGVIDGDTLEVLHNQRPERIRLSGIDCPEKVDQ